MICALGLPFCVALADKGGGDNSDVCAKKVSQPYRVHETPTIILTHTVHIGQMKTLNAALTFLAFIFAVPYFVKDFHMDD